MAVRRPHLAFSDASVLQVQLCETRRELQELKASVRVTQKEKQQLLAEKRVRLTGSAQQSRVWTEAGAVWSPGGRFIGTCRLIF